MSEKRKRYRYILAGSVLPDEPVSHFRLVAATNLKFTSAHGMIRITIPDDMKLSKLSCDAYSTTDDPRPLRRLEATPLVKMDGVWRTFESLWPKYPPGEWYTELRKQGLYPTLSDRGYLREKQYREYIEKKRGEIT